MDKLLILNKIQEYYNYKKDVDFAQHLGIPAQNLSKWKKRNTYDAALIYTKCTEINPEWLLSGKGSMLKSVLKNEFVPDQTNYKELADARLQIIELKEEKIKRLENEIATLKQSAKNPIVYKNVAEPAPELIAEKHK